ncbi:hypothetical protein A3H53_01100 [Candidatus Nomurabacteria bacterium RIFCSPLOWO2_02_FULL_40_10]|uniref:Uncharacterized protein n=1 Tax=Candidatus Nomurabacteria bacterium RIFCSPLOWO2_02_FULL_40_10 TaxID=1801786 RepID=A0A1F6XXZ3_9BACT|nr:MAG: hypothetical protein A3H53_01100 [Candidatus Nomurabacteria bacterium RIFCSPLOWO2_02_FULL_40_10]OGZ72981.1 MAG: hypothetical protein A3A98_03160 [Candidatus Staskawiczbacteria bacterium RIFCSPLOWO2_01_FULL_40_39]
MDRFKLGKKWFWIGIAAGLLNPILGLIYGIALVVEKDHRKEGIIVIIWTIVWAVISYYLSIWLVKQGYLPTFELKSPGKLIR